MMMTKMVPIGVNDHFSLFAEIIRDKPIDFLELIFLFPKTLFLAGKQKEKSFSGVRVVVFVFFACDSTLTKNLTYP